MIAIYQGATGRRCHGHLNSLLSWISVSIVQIAPSPIQYKLLENLPVNAALKPGIPSSKIVGFD
ncbi:hypothetical protein [Phyllobacterium sp. OV277]|uniref:hypothetical protein n=1 Tax=Phyllobacterium sp. OV277 TaxID=1882772 RepID=UPI001587B5AD|nr:hypothetical protein [Phyllobacterium sp. OV277]